MVNDLNLRCVRNDKGASGGCSSSGISSFGVDVGAVLVILVEIEVTLSGLVGSGGRVSVNVSLSDDIGDKDPSTIGSPSIDCMPILLLVMAVMLLLVLVLMLMVESSLLKASDSFGTASMLAFELSSPSTFSVELLPPLLISSLSL